MTPAVMAWANLKVRRYKLAKASVLEVGALNVNGSVRPFFKGPYVAVDFREGRGVDLVMDGHDLRFDDASFDVVVSTEMIEHDSAFWQSLAEMGRVLRPGGHLLLTTRGNGFQLHSHPYDYWRFMPDSGGLLMGLASCSLVDTVADARDRGVFVHGRRKG